MRAYQFCVLTTTVSRANIWVSKMHLSSPRWLRLLSVLRRWSAVVDLLLIVLPIFVCSVFVFALLCITLCSF